MINMARLSFLLEILRWVLHNTSIIACIAYETKNLRLV